MKDKLQKIREKIARALSFFLNSLQKEPVSEDLEEAAKHYLYSNILYDDVYVGNPTDKDCVEMFKAGAKWQKDKFIALLNAEKDKTSIGLNELENGIEHGRMEVINSLTKKLEKL